MMSPNEVTLYLRKSDKDGGRSVARQEATLTAAAPEEGLTIGRVFVDPDFSASRFAKRARPDYAALLAHIEAGECRVVGLFEGSRGSRGLAEWAAFLDLCREHQIRVWIFNDRVYKPWRTNDRKALATIGVDAEHETDQLHDRVTDGKEKAAAAGRPPGRNPYGHARSYVPGPKGKPRPVQSPDPIEAPIVREIVGRIGEGVPLSTIARTLNGRGATRRNGTAWTPQAIRETALNIAHIGRRIHKGQDYGDAAWPAIVEPEDWYRAAAILRAESRRTTTRGTELAHWLSGVVLCGSCLEARLESAVRSRGGAALYVCKACFGITVAARRLEAVIDALVLARLAEPGVAELFRARKVDSQAAHAATRRLQSLRDELDAARASFAAPGGISPQALALKESAMAPAIEKAEADVRRLSVPPVLADLLDVDVVAEWADLGPVRQRAVVRVVAEIVVAPATRKGPRFDVQRLAGSRWVGDTRTWGQIWGHALTPVADGS